MIYKNILLLFICLLLIQNPCTSRALIGEVTKQEFKNTKPQVIDKTSKVPLKDVTVSVPTEGKVDFTDENGFFNLSPSSNKPVILSIQKDGYRPFSLTVQEGALKGGVTFELEKLSPYELIVSDNLLHLGDNSYSENLDISEKRLIFACKLTII